MSRTNTRPETLRTHEGAVASRINAEMQLRRSVMACMLFEGEFYEDGETIAKRIESLVSQVSDDKVAQIAIDAREKSKLRHVPLLLVRMLAKKGSKLTADTLERVIQRADELAEFVALYWKEGKQPLSAQVKKGLAKAFNKFSAYALAKYNRDNAIKLRDVLFLVHAKPKDDEQAAVWKKLVDGTLESPDTWEVSLSAGKDKKETWLRLMAENKLGALALLRNLRNMKESNVPEIEIRKALASANVEKVLPFRFITAAKYAPGLEDALETLMFKCLEQTEKLSGSTLLVIDTSGSMHSALSSKSELNRLSAAGALGALAREICETPVVYVTAGNDGLMQHATKRIPARRGFGLIDYITGGEVQRDIGGGGIFLAQCLDFIDKDQGGRKFDRVIIFTDEQDCDRKLNPDTAKLLGERNYMVNIASAKNGIGYRRWHHVDGFSESILDYIIQFEASEKQRLAN